METLAALQPSRHALVPSNSGPGGPTVNLTPLRQEAQCLVQSGLDAIDRALSHDATAFLRASRQSGGQ